MIPIDQISFQTLATLTANQAHKYRLIPAEIKAESILCYGGEEAEAETDELEFLLGKNIELKLVSQNDFNRFLGKYYPKQKQVQQKEKTDFKEESEVVRFVRKILQEASVLGASDIHIERYESFARIRFRWEGQLLEKYEVKLDQYNAVISRIKIMAELDISERRLPQDGRIYFENHGKKNDVRVSTIPGKFGEKVVMRLLDRSPEFLQLSKLGMESEELERFQLGLKHSNGIILITGPTGSGKTTTLYASLTQLNQPDVNLMTIEDPIEYNLEGINQVQVKDEIGLTFSAALRAYLRQDPDIIMVGEIRDEETAEIAVRAALTGHLVFSTLHTNSAWDAITRLDDMGVAPYLIASSIRMVVAQRLLRLLCPECKKPSNEILFESVQKEYALTKHQVAQGCTHCHYTGYAGRRAIYEVIPITAELSQKIKNKDLDISDYLTAKNIKSIRQHVIELLQRGGTSLEEGIKFLV